MQEPTFYAEKRYKFKVVYDDKSYTYMTTTANTYEQAVEQLEAILNASMKLWYCLELQEVTSIANTQVINKEKYTPIKQYMYYAIYSDSGTMQVPIYAENIEQAEKQAIEKLKENKRMWVGIKLDSVKHYLQNKPIICLDKDNNVVYRDNIEE